MSDTTIKDQSGRTGKQVAEHQGHAAVLDVLREAVAARLRAGVAVDQPAAAAGAGATVVENCRLRPGGLPMATSDSVAAGAAKVALASETAGANEARGGPNPQPEAPADTTGGVGATGSAALGQAPTTAGACVLA